MADINLTGPIALLADIAVLLIVAAVGFLFRGVSTNAQRITKLEAASEVVDVLREVKDVHERINELASSVASQGGELKQINNTLANIHSALIKSPE